MFKFTILFLSITIFVFSGCAAKINPGNNQAAECSPLGETIGAGNMPDVCCSGLKPIGGWPGGYEGDCSLPAPPTGLSQCAPCGNSICDTNYGENKCNCPEDCL